MTGNSISFPCPFLMQKAVSDMTITLCYVVGTGTKQDAYQRWSW